jgi:hypothetical protein
MKKLLLFVLLALSALSAPANAQQASSAFIVSSCGTLPAGLTYAAGQFGILTMDTTGKLCDSATGGGGGGGAITAASGSYASGALSSGSVVDLGSQADAACGTATGTCSLIALQKFNNTATNSAIPAGSAIIGQTGIDQTTPGTTNKVTVGALPRAARNTPGCTVGATSGTCLAAATAITFLQIQNTSTANTVACNIVGGTAVLNSATSVQLAVGQSASWGPNTGGVPSGAINCIASGASTPLYVEWN